MSGFDRLDTSSLAQAERELAKRAAAAFKDAGVEPDAFEKQLAGWQEQQTGAETNALAVSVSKLRQAAAAQLADPEMRHLIADATRLNVTPLPAGLRQPSRRRHYHGEQLTSDWAFVARALRQPGLVAMPLDAVFAPAGAPMQPLGDVWDSADPDGWHADGDSHTDAGRDQVEENIRNAGSFSTHDQTITLNRGFHNEGFHDVEAEVDCSTLVGEWEYEDLGYAYARYIIACKLVELDGTEHDPVETRPDGVWGAGSYFGVPPFIELPLGPPANDDHSLHFHFRMDEGGHRNQTVKLTLTASVGVIGFGEAHVRSWIRPSLKLHLWNN